MKVRHLSIVFVALLIVAPLKLAVGQVSTGQYPAATNPNPNANQDQNLNKDRMTTGKSMDRTDTERQACKASEIVGLTVRTEKDEEKGKIKDLMIGHDGRVVYAAVSFGGFLGVGDKLFAVPFEAIHVVKNGNKIEFARVDVTEDTIKSRKGFDQDHWPEQADPSFLNGARNAERPLGSNVPTER
ncbi:MAG TPA: PRC-barrel domain-containing protein [Lacipirellulaceae bacterium]|jgi:hypothetical protein